MGKPLGVDTVQVYNLYVLEHITDLLESQENPLNDTRQTECDISNNIGNQCKEEEDRKKIIYCHKDGPTRGIVTTCIYT